MVLDGVRIAVFGWIGLRGVGRHTLRVLLDTLRLILCSLRRKSETPFVQSSKISAIAGGSVVLVVRGALGGGFASVGCRGVENDPHCASEGAADWAGRGSGAAQEPRPHQSGQRTAQQKQAQDQKVQDQKVQDQKVSKGQAQEKG